MSSSDVMPMLQKILSKIEDLEKKIDGNSSTSSDSQEDSPKSIKDLETYLTTYLNPFYEVCEKLGGGALEAGTIVKEGWLAMKSFLVLASKCKEPPQAALMPLLQDISAKIKDSSKVIQRNEWEKHYKTCSEGMAALNWLVVKPAPCDFIESSIGGSDYWANGIRKEFKGKNTDQILFCDSFKALIINLMGYVKEHHRTGVSWNNRSGVDVSQYKANDSKSAAQPAAVTAAAPVAAAPAKPAAIASSGAGLFSELNKGGDITSGLKKVTKDMQTWRAEFNGGGAPPVSAAPKKVAASTPAAKATPQVVKTPKFEFQSGGNKWVVEHQVEGTINVEINDKKETVYIYGCSGCTVDIKGKCKSVIMDGCKKIKVYFDNAMASCEVVNCQRMQVHCREIVAAVAIDKTDGIVVFLPKSSLSTEIVASKSSEMNLTWPDENGDLIEKPIPEQYVHRIKDNAITADVSDLYTH